MEIDPALATPHRMRVRFEPEELLRLSVPTDGFLNGRSCTLRVLFPFRASEGGIPLALVIPALD